MSENQEEGRKPEVPPPSLSKGPAEPPPPSAITGSPSPPPPPSVVTNPPPPPTATPNPRAPTTRSPGKSPIHVRVKPDGEEGEEAAEEPGEPLVPLGTRVGAALIDYGIAIALYMAAVTVLPDFLARAGGLLAAAYIVLRDGLPFLNGQSVGKMAMKIRAVTRDGTSLAGNWQPAVVRNIALLLFPVFPLIELIVLLTREDKPDQGVRLGDEWAKTKVVPAAPEAPAAEDSEPKSNDES